MTRKNSLYELLEICLIVRSADIAQDLRQHWIYLCEKSIQGKKTYPG